MLSVAKKHPSTNSDDAVIIFFMLMLACANKQVLYNSVVALHQAIHVPAGGDEAKHHQYGGQNDEIE